MADNPTIALPRICATIEPSIWPVGMNLDALNAKYETQTELDFLDPAVNAVYRVQPLVVIALDDERFRESPTRWLFH